MRVPAMIAALTLAAALPAADSPAPAQTPAPAPAAAAPPAAAPAGAQAPPAAEPAPHAAGAVPPPTEAELAALTWDEVADDNGFVGPFARNFDSFKDSDERRKDWDDFIAKFDAWAPGKVADPFQRVLNLICVAGLMDVGQGQFESECPLMIYERLTHQMPKEQLQKILGIMVFHPNEGTIIANAPELDLNIGVGEDQVRERVIVYAKKMLGRMLGKLPMAQQ
jgi:hypothetical protein